jgi:hypothetical protein
MLGKGITIHKVDTVFSFGAPFQLFTYRSGYFAMNAALESAELNFTFGEIDGGEKGLNISDFTIFVPTDDAFKNIGSVLKTADKKTLQTVLLNHIIPNNVIFSTSLGNVTVQSLGGGNLTFTVLPDGTAWVNNAKITFPNTILYNGVAHVIDNVLAPGNFDRASLKNSAPASERVAFPSATPVSQLPFSSVSFFGDLMTYSSTPTLLKTAIAVATAQANATTTMSPSGMPAQVSTNTGSGLLPGALIALSIAVGVAAIAL